MAGAKKGVAKQIMDIERHALFMHCYGHTLNLACSDAVKGCKLLKSALETTREITKLIKFSPRREAIFQEVKKLLRLKLLVYAFCVQLAGLYEEIALTVFVRTILYCWIRLRGV